MLFFSILCSMNDVSPSPEMTQDPSVIPDTTETPDTPETVEAVNTTDEPTTSPETSVGTSSEEMTNPDEVIANLQQELAAQLKEVANLNEQLETYKKRYINLAAEFDNFRKRTQREKEEQQKQITAKTITELLAVVDNFERARTQIKPNTDGEMEIHKSYQSVYKSLVEGLKKLGVSPMRPEGQPFDPAYHEAMLREQTNDHPEGTVLEELVRGYLLGDIILRHAMVKVAAPLESVIPSEGEVSETSGSGN